MADDVYDKNKMNVRAHLKLLLPSLSETRSGPVTLSRYNLVNLARHRCLHQTQAERSACGAWVIDCDYRLPVILGMRARAIAF